MSGHGANRPGSAREWWFIFLVSSVSFLLGWYGIYDSDKCVDHYSPASEAYQALQLFVLHGAHVYDGSHNDSLPWQLHAGRWGAAFVLLWAALKIAGKILGSYTSLARQVWWPGHAVICGLGDLGLPMAREAKQCGWRLVAIERSESSEGAHMARSLGIPVIIGNACDERILRGARVQRASRLWVLTDEDDINIGVAVIAGRIARPRYAPKLICRPFINEPRLRQSLRDMSNFSERTPKYRVETGPDLFDLRARHAFESPERSLDHIPVTSNNFATLVILGFDEMGQALARQALRIGHFHSTSHEHLEIVVVDEDAQSKVENFTGQFRQLHNFASIYAEPSSRHAATQREHLVKLCRKAHASERPITFAFCFGNERNMSLAIDLANALPAGPASLLVYLSNADGLAHLLSEDGTRSADIDPRIHAFGMREAIWTLDSLEHDRDDKLAQQFHKAYLADRKAAREEAQSKGENYKSRPAEKPWEELSEFFRGSNRAIADHVPVKMRALGYRIEKLAEQDEQLRVKSLSDDQIHTLAMIEHRRWCAYYWLNGWQYDANRNDAQKRHNLLVPWKELSEKDRYIDKAMMQTIVESLEAVGEGVFRKTVG